LVLTKNGVVTVGVQSPDKLPQIEVQIGRVKGERLFATIGVGTDVAATDVGVDMASALSKALSTVRARIDQNVQNCVVDGPCAKTCMDEKTKKPYCCKFECAK
jgi:hypothetical protein